MSVARFEGRVGKLGLTGNGAVKKPNPPPPPVKKSWWARFVAWVKKILGIG